MAYTYGGNKTKSVVPVQSSLFSNLQNDGQRTPLPYGNRMDTQDATSSPNASPLTVATTATLTVPQNASQVVIVSTTNAVQVSEDSTETAYFTLPAGVVWPFDVANQQYIYLKTTGSTVVNFYFVLI